MNVARIMYPVQVLGPGKRVGIWVAGCSRGCKGCSNPELWEQKPEYEISVDHLASLVENLAHDHTIDGFTISGGEPLNQPEELSALVQCLISISSDILVYTGYQIEELKNKQDQSINSVLSKIAVLIDGEYVEELNDGTFMRGSSNQRVHLLSVDHKEKYQNYFSDGHNQIQNFTTSDGVVSVGIHHKTF